MFYFKNGNYSFFLQILVNIFLFVKQYLYESETMTKKELASRINVDPKTLKNWESSKPELLKLIYLGLATEEHAKDVKKYLEQITAIENNADMQK